MKNLWSSIVAFFAAYPSLVHIALLVWNAFVMSWATKTSFVLYGFSINASVSVSWLQAALHCPTWVIGALTFALNAYTMYANFKNNQGKIIEAKQTLHLK